MSLQMVYECEDNLIYFGNDKYSGVYEYMSYIRIDEEKWRRPMKAFFVP